MARPFIEGRIENPHPDIEIGAPRAPVAYRIAPPAGGIGPGTGLILFAYGYGGHYADAYADRLLPSLADRYDCLCIAVDYQGAAPLAGVPGTTIHAPPDLIDQVRRFHGLHIEDGEALASMPAYCRALLAHGVTRLDSRIEFELRSPRPELFSFGLLPALDHLEVLHRVLRDHPVDRRRLYFLGTSYGGYLGCLLLKLAPRSFRLIIDNSGFVSATDAAPNVFGLGISTYHGVTVQVRMTPSWNLDPTSRYFFSPAHYAIRDLLAPGHMSATDTAVYSYLSVADELVPMARKLALANSLLGRVRFDLKLVRQSDLDGRLFKVLTHGMRASLRGLFADAYERYQGLGTPPADVTDFDLGTRIDFACHQYTYRIAFDGEGVRLERQARG